MGRSRTKGDTPRTNTGRLNVTIRELLRHAVKPATWCVYKRAYKLLMKFKAEISPNRDIFPVSSSTLSHFIAYMYTKNYAANTIVTYTSTVQSIHKLMELPEPGLSFINKKLLLGVQRSRGTDDARLPITREILHKLIRILPQICQNTYNRALLAAMFLVAFHAFLRIGEMVVTQKRITQTILQLQDVVIMADKQGLAKMLHITLTSWKHSKPGQNFMIQIPSSRLGKDVCPVFQIVNYLKLRGKHKGALFCMQDRTPCSRDWFSQQLRKTVNKIGLDPKRFKTHSFRIGATTTAAAMGVSDVNIQKLGRWRSQAFQKYIRHQSLHSV